ncbi:MAG TPA: helix-turn-helix domain-containing protein [Chitinophagaceae bacterium]|nr:helix-turn-helix domain-containing protein [Chitinophagaceae bacterium]
MFDSPNTIFETAASFINQTSKHLFLTGKAGTGKTTFLKYISEHAGKKAVVVAPTGVAAINCKSIAEIAAERSLAFSTIEGHLAGFVSTGEINVPEMVDQSRLEKISEALEKNPALTASELRQQLGEDYSYAQIKAVISYRLMMA